MTAAAPRPAAPEARMATYGAVAEIVYSTPERRVRFLLAAENRNLGADMARAALYDTPAHRELQLAIWAERERRALVAEVAWA